MPAEVQIVAGPARCGKTQHLLGHYLSRLDPSRVGHCCWLSPNRAALSQIQDQLIQQANRALLAPNLYTFSAYADTLIARSQRPIRPLTPLQKRRLLQLLLRAALEQNRLKHFASVAHTPGFALQVDEFIAQLKRADIWPEQFQQWATQRPAEDRQLRELALLYTDYQQALLDGELYDAEGRFWAARDFLTHEPQANHQQYDLIVVNGFNDFTTAQYDILKLLSERTSQLCITLTVEQPNSEPPHDDSRTLLFAKTSNTLARLKKYFPTLKIQTIPSEPPQPNSLHQLQQQLFRESSDPQTTSEKFHGIEVLAANSELGEIEAIAERIKSLLFTGNTHPQEIAVVTRADELANRTIATVFRDYGIPANFESRSRLEAQPQLRTLLTLLRLHQEDWPFLLLLEVINNRLIECFDLQANPTDSFALQPRVALEQSLRAAQLPSGRAALLEQLEYRSNPEQQPSDQHAAQSSLALRELGQLSQILAELPESASLPQWTKALQKLLKQLGVLPAQSESSSRAAKAWNLLRHGLLSITQVDDWSSAAETQLTLPKLIELIALVSREQRVAAEHDSLGCVQILSAESARKLTIKHLFLAGLSEQSFSTSLATNSTSADESQSLFDSLPDTLVEPVPTNVRHSDSMLLFYELATRPTHSLTLSYPALDPKGQPLSPSPLLTELVRCAGSDRITQRTMPLGEVVRPDSRPYSQGAFRRQAVDQALQGKHRWLAGAIAQPDSDAAGNSILAGIGCVAQRSSRATFSPHEGLLLSESAQAALAARFDAKHLWSPSQLEGYATCPFRFFAEHLLHLEPLNELTLRNDPRRRGNLLHQVLATIHQQLSAATRDAEATDAELIDQFLSTLSATVEANPLRGLEQALREIERREIEAWAPDYAQQETDYRSQWQHLDQPPRPAHFEVRFGPDTSSDTLADQASTPVPFELDLGDERICLTGQIDRVDIGRIGNVTVFNIIDYKSGKAVKLQPDKVRAGQQLQLPLYALAAEQLLLADRDAMALATGYWNIRGKGFETSKGGSLQLRELAGQDLQTSAHWQQLQPEIFRRVQELITGIRGGHFPVYNEDQHCTRSCSLSTICRVAQIRSLEKVWPIPDENPRLSERGARRGSATPSEGNHG